MDGLSDLFLNTDYELKTFTFGDTEVRLNVSTSASTDYDLTGQILWPAARILASHLAANPALLLGRSACELGAGLGLVGTVANQRCPVVLTDHNEVVLDILEANGFLNQKDHECRTMQLEWRSATDIAAVLAASPEGLGYDLLLGADVCYSQNMVPHLFRAAATLMRRTPGATFQLGYVSRAAMVDRQVLEEAAANGFAVREVPGTRSEEATLTGWVYELTWQRPTASARVRDGLVAVHSAAAARWALLPTPPALLTTSVAWVALPLLACGGVLLAMRWRRQGLGGAR